MKNPCRQCQTMVHQTREELDFKEMMNIECEPGCHSIKDGLLFIERLLQKARDDKKRQFKEACDKMSAVFDRTP